MDFLKIKGNKPLKGEVEISGSKNAALPLLVAGITSAKPLKITNLPRLSDVDFILRLLIELGANVRMLRENGTISAYVEMKNDSTCIAPYDIVRKMRASIWVMGPLLARYGKVTVSMPGGCAIGARPVNLHTMVMEKLGAKIEINGGNIIATSKKQLQGCEIVFPFVSVGATQAALLTTVLSKGTSILKNVSMEPETIELGRLLKKLGANIEGLGTDTLVIKGTPERVLPGMDEDYPVIPDRIEAGTYAIAAAATRGKVIIKGAIREHIELLLYHLQESGVEVHDKDNGILIDASKIDRIKPVDIVTAAYPGFPTDLQAQWMAYMTVADGSTQISEKIFENRFIHIGELLRFGARIRQSGNVATVTGVKSLKGAPVMATDLRASASLVIGSLIAQGTSEIHRVYHIDRGYERIDEKLTKLGVDITRLSE